MLQRTTANCCVRNAVLVDRRQSQRMLYTPAASLLLCLATVCCLLRDNRGLAICRGGGTNVTRIKVLKHAHFVTVVGKRLTLQSLSPDPATNGAQRKRIGGGWGGETEFRRTGPVRSGTHSVVSNQPIPIRMPFRFVVDPPVGSWKQAQSITPTHNHKQPFKTWLQSHPTSIAGARQCRWSLGTASSRIDSIGCSRPGDWHISASMAIC